MFICIHTKLRAAVQLTAVVAQTEMLRSAWQGIKTIASINQCANKIKKSICAELFMFLYDCVCA